MQRPVLAALAVALACHLGLMGCTSVVAPLGLRQADAEPGSERDNVSLVRIAVCWSGLPLVEDVVQMQAEGDAQSSFEVLPMHSGEALEMVGSGAADLAVVGWQPEGEDLKASGPGSPQHDLVTHVLAQDAIAVIVHADAPLGGLSRAELARLFEGRIVDWAELKAGQGRPELVSPGPGATSRMVLARSVLTGSLGISSAAILVPHDRGVVDYVASHKLAVGYVSAAYVDERVRAVPIDGVVPTPSEVKRGRYPLVHAIVAVAPTTLPRSVASLLDLAQSARGRAIIERRYVSPN